MEAYITDDLLQMWLANVIDLETIYFQVKRETGLSNYSLFVDVFMNLAIERYG